MVNFEAIKSEKGLRTLIKRNLNKEIHPGTKPSIDFIYKILEDAYSSDLSYDVTDMRNAVLAFAAKVIFNFLKKKGDESFERVFKSILGRRNVR